jgi:hypothetical protein
VLRERAWRLPIVPPRASPSAGSLWSPETQSLIDRGAVLPVISNYLLPGIFVSDPADLATAWAEDITSPLPERDNRELARVAQFFSVKAGGVRKARVEYHNAVKRYLVALAKADPSADAEYVEGLIADPAALEAVSLSEIARNLGYPRFEDPARNPMRLLAELPLPIYLTTCHHTFLEVALAQTGHKEPVTEIFYWDDAQRNIPSIYEREPEYRPSVERPLVYHLFGVDTYPDSIVLSEDDYVSVLMRLSELKRDVKVSDAGPGGIGSSKLDIPSEIKAKLSGDGLLMLGYNVNDWDFRVLFRWLARYTGPSREGLGAPDAVCLQVRPVQGQDQRIQEYLTQFFEQKRFKVYWGDPETCVYELWSRWKRR